MPGSVVVMGKEAVGRADWVRGGVHVIHILNMYFHHCVVIMETNLRWL